MKHAFILSDCEYPECKQKSFALLTANPTKEHHYIAQTEQRQHAHNPEISQHNQNVYRLPLVMFHKPHISNAQSVNIENNLAAKNLYTLTFVPQSDNQYNLESWFNRHESGYENSCDFLRTLPAGILKIPDALWRILRLKFLGILRNPNNHKNLFVYRIHQAIREHLPEISFEFVRLISQRDQKCIEVIMKNYGFSFLGYINWLANLYGMLSEGASQPSLFEKMFNAAFAKSKTVKIELYRYPNNTLCLFNDSGFCLQASKTLISIGVNISHDMFAIVHIQATHWQELRHDFHNDTTPLQGIVHIHDNEMNQRLIYNRLTIQQAKKYLFGQSPNTADYQ